MKPYLCENLLVLFEEPSSDGRRAKNFKLRLEGSRDHCLGLFNNGVCLGYCTFSFAVKLAAPTIRTILYIYDLSSY